MVSICIPAYNSIDLFRRCLDSVLAQEFKDYEIIVSDDSTDDAIAGYIKELAHPALKYFHNKPGLGSPDNWNNAMKHALGDYIKILHHDDYFTDRHSLGKFVRSLEVNPQASFAFCWSRIYFRQAEEYFVHKPTRTQLRRMSAQKEFLFFRNIIGAPSATFFRNIPELRFDPAYQWLVDVDFYMRYLGQQPGFVLVPEALVTVVDGESGQITTRVSNEKTRVISEHLRLFSGIYSERLNTKKAWLYFQELFIRFHISNYAELRAAFEIPAKLEIFLQAVFSDLPKHTLWKAIRKRLLTSRYNKRIFKIERF